MVFKTNNSTYEVDGMEIRRISGTNPPTNHFSPDGEWKTFKDISSIQINYPVWISWLDGKYTQTSVVQFIEIQDPMNA